MAEPGVRFLYVPASNLDAMRRFYTELLGLEEVWFAAAEGVAYDCAGLQFTILHDPEAAAAEGWATQPGWTGDTVGAISWSVVLSEPAYRKAVAELSAEPGIRLLHQVPQWVGYWSFPVTDPMGNTVELSWPTAEPGSPRWAS